MLPSVVAGAVGVLRAVGSIERAGLLTNLLTNASRRAGTQLDVTDGDRDEMAAQRDFVVQRDTRWHLSGWVQVLVPARACMFESCLAHPLADRGWPNAECCTARLCDLLVTSAAAVVARPAPDLRGPRPGRNVCPVLHAYDRQRLVTRGSRRPGSGSVPRRSPVIRRGFCHAVGDMGFTATADKSDEFDVGCSGSPSRRS